MGKYDKYVVATYEKKSLKDFKRRYKKVKKLKYSNIGIENYMFMHDLFCRKNKISNPEQLDCKEMIKRSSLESIYNNGKINLIYENLPERRNNLFSNYNNIFTTNYDNNIAQFSGPEVHYLYGEFYILSDVYNKG